MHLCLLDFSTAFNNYTKVQIVLQYISGVSHIVFFNENQTKTKTQFLHFSNTFKKYLAFCPPQGKITPLSSVVHCTFLLWSFRFLSCLRLCYDLISLVPPSLFINVIGLLYFIFILIDFTHLTTYGTRCVQLVMV